MLYAVMKALLSGIIVAAVSEIAKRNPSLGALVLSLPLLSILAFIWLRNDTGDNVRIAAQAEATFWYILPTLPMFLVLPALLRGGMGFWPSLGLSCLLTFILYLATVWIAAKFGVAL